MFTQNMTNANIEHTWGKHDQKLVSVGYINASTLLRNLKWNQQRFGVHKQVSTYTHSSHFIIPNNTFDSTDRTRNWQANEVNLCVVLKSNLALEKNLNSVYDTAPIDATYQQREMWDSAGNDVTPPTIITHTNASDSTASQCWVSPN